MCLLHDAALCLELGGMDYDISNANRKGTKCKVRCSGIESQSTVSACNGTTVSYTAKGKGGSCEEMGLIGDAEDCSDSDCVLFRPYVG